MSDYEHLEDDICLIEGKRRVTTGQVAAIARPEGSHKPKWHPASAVCKDRGASHKMPFGIVYNDKCAVKVRRIVTY